MWAKVLKEFQLYQEKEEAFLEGLLAKDHLTPKELETLQANLYERRKFHALFRNLKKEKTNDSFLLKKILTKEKEIREKFLLLAKRLEEKQRDLQRHQKALQHYEHLSRLHRSPK